MGTIYIFFIVGIVGVASGWAFSTITHCEDYYNGYDTGYENGYECAKEEKGEQEGEPGGTSFESIK